MNFLAHFHLAWPDPGLLAGGLEGDYYKGPLRGELPLDLERGVQLHRAVDAYTDRHPRIAALRRALPRELRRYAGILVDLSFDHYLSLHWTRFGPLPLEDFNARVYAALAAREADLSPGAQAMFARLVEHDILNLYHDWDTVTATARRLGERFPSNPFLDVEASLAPLRAHLEEAFLHFYPQLQAFSRERAASLGV
ncbi:MAG: ACP phosphodiesterase [Halioglobus sp.]|nr:ACP phosphodiesterase [Halioglobus sp.]